MQTFTAQLERSGRILIPAPIRRQLGLDEGSHVIVRVDEAGALQIETRRQAVARVQGRLRKYVPEARLVSEELIADRRAEVAREEKALRASRTLRAAGQKRAPKK